MLVVILPVRGAAAQSAPVDPANPNDVIYKLSGGDAPTDYIVAIDNSVSMRNAFLYRRVLGALRTILPTLPPNDHLSLITFNSSVELAYSGPMTDPLAEINRLPEEATSVPNRDTGKALEEVVNELERPDASPTAAVLLFANGAANPASTSTYRLDNEAAWGALRSRVQALDRPVNAVTFRFGGAASGTDAERVFGDDHTLIGPPPEQIGRYLKDVVDRQRVEIAKDVAQEALAQPIMVEWRVDALDVDAGSADVALTLRWGTKIPLVLRRPKVTVAGLPEGRVVGLGDQVPLAPDGTAKMTGRLEWGQVNGGPVNPVRSADAKLTLTSGFDSPYREALQTNLGLRLAPVFEPVAFEPDVSGAFNAQPFVLLAVVAASVLIAAAALWVYQHPSLAGSRLEVDIPNPTGSIADGASLSKRRHTIGQGGTLLARLPGKGSVRGVRNAFRKDGHEVRCRLVYERRGKEEHTFTANEPPLTLHGVRFTYRR
jgi:hypothetical protein